VEGESFSGALGPAKTSAESTHTTVELEQSGLIVARLVANPTRPSSSQYGHNYLCRSREDRFKISGCKERNR
jgi:hypothetical protein